MTQNVRMKKTNEIYLSIFINLLNWKQSFEKVFWSKASEYTAGTFLTMETRNCTTEDFFFFFKVFDDCVTKCIYYNAESREGLFMQNLFLNSSFVWFS